MNWFSKESKTKSILFILSAVILVSLFGTLIIKSQAYYFSGSIFRDLLQVQKTGEFGGGIVVGLDLIDAPDQNGLVVYKGKVGIGTTSPVSLLSVAGDVTVTGKIKAQGGYENPITCPIFSGSAFICGNKFTSADCTAYATGATLYNGFVSNYGILINEFSPGKDERLFWSGCTVNPANNTITLTDPGIYDGGVDQLFSFGDRDEIMPTFRKAQATQSLPTHFLQSSSFSSSIAFCEELGLEYVSQTIASGNVKDVFYDDVAWGMWVARISAELRSYATSITCQIP